jgi:hypothetical protein
MPREWVTVTREPWCLLIKQCLAAIDRHNRLFFETGDRSHLLQAERLRQYVIELKDWISHHERAAGAEPPRS